MSRPRCVECDSPDDEGHDPTCPVLENERALRAADSNEIMNLVNAQRPDVRARSDRGAQS